MRTKLVLPVRNDKTELRPDYATQLVTMVWYACTQTSRLGILQIVLKPYLFYSNCRVMFEVIVVKNGILHSCLERVMPEGIGLWCQVRLKIGQQQAQEALDGSATVTLERKLCHTLHLKFSASSNRWWRAGSFIR